MNSLWLQRIADYRHLPVAFRSAQNIIQQKIRQQKRLLVKYGIHHDFDEKNIAQAPNMEDLFLREARTAHIYWKHMGEILKGRVDFSGRQPRSTDPANRILDIGYHHVTNKVAQIFDQHRLYPVIGIMHRSHSSTSKPLAYDLVELFRADTVDAEMLRFFRLKKKLVEKLEKRDIVHFLSRLNKRMEHDHYLQQFGDCRSYAYFMELQILHFARAVREKRVFKPDVLPNRHEGRCPHNRA